MSYTGQDGFLGTGASLLADLVLLAYIFLIVPAMVTGFVFARRKMFRPYHKFMMITITSVNWVLIVLLMVRALFYDVTDKFGDEPGNSRYLFPAIHAALGLSAQLLGTYVIYRMLKEDRGVAAAKKRGEKDLSKYWFSNAKIPMRITLGLWLIVAALGVASYLYRYEVVDSFNIGAEKDRPVTTPEATEEPVATEESQPTETETPSPALNQTITPEATEEQTPEPAGTEEASPVAETAEPATTQEAISPAETEAPIATEEATATATRAPLASATPTARPSPSY